MGYRPSFARIIRETIKEEVKVEVETQIVESGGTPGGGAGSVPIKLVSTLEDLEALPADQKKEGVIYIVTSTDMTMLFDPPTNSFISRAGETEYLDGGDF